MNYLFHPEAEAEHLETVTFYETRRKGLGGLYLAEFENTMVRVAGSPERYRIERKPNIRGISLLKFPYKLFFAM
jgi:hypothetical protein